MGEDLTPAGRAELASLEAELPQVEARAREAEAEYAAHKPRYDELRRTHPRVALEETDELRRFGMIQARIAQVRDAIAWLRGEGPPPGHRVVRDDRAIRSVERAFGTD